MILCLTDTHDQPINLSGIDIDQIDVILHAGDFSVFGQGYEENCNLLNDLDKPVLFVLGNHEVNDLDPFMIEEKYPNFKYVGNQSINIELFGKNVSIIGIDGENGISPDTGQDNEDTALMIELVKSYSLQGKSILLSHFQPQGLLNSDPYGCRCVREVYEMINPDFTVCGHLHKAIWEADKRILNPFVKMLVKDLCQQK